MELTEILAGCLSAPPARPGREGWLGRAEEQREITFPEYIFADLQLPCAGVIISSTAVGLLKVSQKQLWWVLIAECTSC